MAEMYATESQCGYCGCYPEHAYQSACESQVPSLADESDEDTFDQTLPENYIMLSELDQFREMPNPCQCEGYVNANVRGYDESRSEFIAKDFNNRSSRNGMMMPKPYYNKGRLRNSSVNINKLEETYWAQWKPSKLQQRGYIQCNECMKYKKMQPCENLQCLHRNPIASNSVTSSIGSDLNSDTESECDCNCCKKNECTCCQCANNGKQVTETAPESIDRATSAVAGSFFEDPTKSNKSHVNSKSMAPDEASSLMNKVITNITNNDYETKVAANSVSPTKSQQYTIVANVQGDNNNPMNIRHGKTIETIRLTNRRKTIGIVDKPTIAKPPNIHTILKTTHENATKLAAMQTPGILRTPSPPSSRARTPQQPTQPNIFIVNSDDTADLTYISPHDILFDNSNESTLKHNLNTLEVLATPKPFYSPLQANNNVPEKDKSNGDPGNIEKQYPIKVNTKSIIINTRPTMKGHSYPLKPKVRKDRKVSPSGPRFKF